MEGSPVGLLVGRVWVGTRIEESLRTNQGIIPTFDNKWASYIYRDKESLWHRKIPAQGTPPPPGVPVSRHRFNTVSLHLEIPTNIHTFTTLSSPRAMA